MESELRRKYIFKVSNENEELQLLDSIHQQLVGEEDYINSNIIINSSKYRDDDTENEVHVYIFKDCKALPIITID